MVRIAVRWQSKPQTPNPEPCSSKTKHSTLTPHTEPLTSQPCTLNPTTSTPNPDRSTLKPGPNAHPREQRGRRRKGTTSQRSCGTRRCTTARRGGARARAPRWARKRASTSGASRGASELQGCLAHKKTPSPHDQHRAEVGS